MKKKILLFLFAVLLLPGNIYLVYLFLSSPARKARFKVEGNPDNFAMNRIRKAVTLVRNSLIPPSLEAAAQACSLSVSRFSCLFHNSMGVSYGQFALRVRLTNAANDVKRGIYTLSEIAERHGFCDASSFCHAFRKVYRCTTHEFKKRNASQELSVLE